MAHENVHCPKCMKASMKPMGSRSGGYQFYVCPRCRNTADIQIETMPAATADVPARPATRQGPYSEVGL